MRKFLPFLLLFLGLGAGVGAGVALKPAATTAEACAPEAAAEAHPPAGEHASAEGPEAAEEHAPAGGAETAADCAEPKAGHAETPAAGDHGAGGHGETTGPEYVALDKPFIVPVFYDERVDAMVVLSVSLEVGPGLSEAVETLQPRLRDNFLAAMFRHANSGGFDGSFTGGQKMEDLRSALLAVAREVMPPETVNGVLITEIVRQDV